MFTQGMLSWALGVREVCPRPGGRPPHDGDCIQKGHVVPPIEIIA